MKNEEKSKTCNDCHFFNSCNENLIYISKKSGKVCKNYLDERECFLKKACFFPERGKKIVTIDENGFTHGKRVRED